MTVRAEQGGDGDDGYHDKMFYTYSTKKTKQASGAVGRTSFIPPSTSPGPAAYSPNGDPVAVAPPKATFGTANRQNESVRFISEMHNRSLPSTDTPGPGTYRVVKAEAHPHNPNHPFTPTWKFGSAPQRTDPDKVPAASVPGPIYNQELPKEGPSYSFAPMGNADLGMTRTRGDDSKMFITAEHIRTDPTIGADDYSMVGPGQYDVDNHEMLSPKKTYPRAVIGRSSRDAKNSMSEEHLRAEPLATTAGKTPGAIYDCPSTLDTRYHKFGSGPRTYAPELGSSKAGPYISKGHESAMHCTQSPGPGCYDVQGGRGKAVGGLGDGPTYPFGVLPNEGDGSTLMRMNVPGPGAYNPKEDKTSAVTTGASYSIASNLRTDFSTMASPAFVPGPGAYNVSDASKAEGQKTKGPSYSLGAQDSHGRVSFIKPTCTPGPCYAPTNGNVEVTQGKGYSFGLKDRSRSARSTVGIRYLGPLAAQESLGTEGPGPIYDTRSGITKLSGKKELPHFKIGTASRSAGPRLYISRQHAEAEGQGLESPGPGAYDHNYKELADVTSRYRKPAAAVFSSSERFKSNYSTF